MKTSRKVLTLDQACDYLGYKKSYLYKLTSSGILSYSKPNGKKIFFEKEKLDAWMLKNPKTSLSEKTDVAATFLTKQNSKNGK